MTKTKSIAQQRWHFAGALKRFMAASKYYKTQTALARKSGVAQSTIGRILRGEVGAHISSVLPLLDALGITPQDFWAAVEGDSPAVKDPGEMPITDAVFQIQACRAARRRAENALERIWEGENQAIEVLERCRQEEAQAVDRLENLVLGHQVQKERHQESAKREVSA